jgi:hypothetical protein
LLSRDITQITTVGKVMFSADTHAAEAWMRQRCGDRTIVFQIPDESEAAVDFRLAAEAESLSIFVMMNPRTMETP